MGTTAGRNVTMRKGFWMFSASAVIAGGLVLSAGLCAETKMLPALEDEKAAPAPAAESTCAHPMSAEVSGDESPKPFIRKKAAAAPVPPKNVKQLFSGRKPAVEPPAGHLETADIELLTSETEPTPAPEPETKAVQAGYVETSNKGQVEPVVHSAAPSAKTKEATPRPVTAPRPVAAPPRVAAKPVPRVQVPSATPSANAEPALVTVKWAPHSDLSVGQESTCVLIVKNEGHGSASDVELSATFPRTVRLLKADPLPGDSQDRLTWTIPSLAAGEERQFRVTLLPISRGDLSTSATVRFSNSASSRFSVSEPQLALSVKGANSTSVGDAATQVVTVTNSGSGVARDIVLNAAIPSGIESSQAKGRKIQLSIGSLAAGETREVKLSMTAIAAGEQVVAISAKAAGNIEETVEVKIAVTAPKLEVAIAGPNVRFANRSAKYQVAVSNKGAAATNNVRVTHHVPAGFEFVKADGGGTFDETQRTVSWFIGHLEAGKSAKVQIELMAKGLGNQSHKVTVAGDSVTATEAKLDTLIDGAAELVMEVKDLDDPVEVATQTAYEIRVRNDGSKSATNVVVSCELPAGVELLGAEGPTKHTAAKGKITFAPAADLAPQKTLTYKVMIQGKVAGQLRFKSQLTSAASAEPITVDELTRFYSD